MQQFRVPREKPRLLPPVNDEFSDFTRKSSDVVNKEKFSAKYLEKLINEELDTINNKGDSEPQARDNQFLVYKVAFGHLIEHVTMYRDLLGEIKAHYDSSVHRLKMEKSYAQESSAKLRALSSTQATLRNYRRRELELNRKLDLINSDTKRLQEKLNQEKKKRDEIRKRDEERRSFNKKKNKNLKKNFLGFAPGIAQEDVDNIEVLQRELHKCDAEIEEITQTEYIRFNSKEIKNNLSRQWASKEDSYREIADHNERLTIKAQMLKVVNEVISSYLEANKCTDINTLLDVVQKAIDSRRGSYDTQIARSAIFEEDDPTKEKEAEIILEYIESFNVLFQDKRYEQAAVHAANSPRGVLRTTQTLNRFKEAERKPNSRSPLLAYCEAIMSSAEAVRHRPTVHDSIEYINCALTEGRDDLVMHWIAQGQLTLSEEIGDIILSFCELVENKKKVTSYTVLAQSVYSQCNCHMKAARCFYRRNQLMNMLSYCQEVNFTNKDFLVLLAEFPNVKISKLFCKRDKNALGPLTLYQVIKLLFSLNKFEVIRNLLLDLNREANSNLLSLVLTEIYTTPKEWQYIIDLADHLELYEIATELKAAVIVRSTLNSLR